MTLPASRPLYLLGFLVCVMLLAVAYYMEYVMDLLPCPLCLVQRGAFALIGLLCLAAVLHNPQPNVGKQRSTGARLYGCALIILAAFGGATAGRQIWLQHQPVDQLPSCLPSLDYMIDVLPVAEMLTLLFSGTADCAKITWTFLGLNIAEYTLLGFIGFALFGLMQLLRRRD